MEKGCPSKISEGGGLWLRLGMAAVAHVGLHLHLANQGFFFEVHRWLRFYPATDMPPMILCACTRDVFGGPICLIKTLALCCQAASVDQL